MNQYCAELGKDPLLVQAAGGNVSWKEDGVLWVKASGAWLSTAEHQNIFVPVDLKSLKTAIDSENYHIKPQVLNQSGLRPSIETIFHALMPQKVVIHLHAVDIIAYLVQKEAETLIMSKIKDLNLQTIFVAYYKPGAALAQQMATSLSKNPKAEVVFLKNHGIVIGGDTIEAAQTILKKLLSALSFPSSRVEHAPIKLNIRSIRNSYLPFPDIAVHQLALDPVLFEKLKPFWALYPDHVVFLGPEPYCYEKEETVKTDLEFIFIRNEGVFMNPLFSLAKQQQLRCYYDVLSRLKLTDSIDVLCKDQIDELLNWDAEKYRTALNKE